MIQVKVQTFGMGTVVVGCLLSFGFAAQATTLPPNSPGVAPQDFDVSGLPAVTFVTSEVTPITSGAGAIHWTADLVSAVYEESNGDLDFFYQIVNSSSSNDGLVRMTLTSFNGFTTDVGYLNTSPGSPFGTPTPVDPLSADRDSIGSTVGFTFYIPAVPPLIPAPLGAKVNPGDASAIEVIRTNSKSYSSGVGGLIDGGPTSGPILAPAAEPTSIMLLGTGLLGLSSLLRKRFVRRA